MNDKIRVPLDLNERVIDHVASGSNDADIGALMAATKFAREEAERLVELQRTVKADPTLTPESAALRMRTFALQSAQRVAAKLDAARVRATTAIATYERSTSAPTPPRDPVSLNLETEIRATLKAAKAASDRKKVIDGAFASRDMLVLGALLRGPAFLSGLSDTELAAARHRYRREFHNEASASADTKRKALEAFDRAGNSFVRLTKGMTDDPLATRAETAQAAREAAESAVRDVK